MFCGWLLCRLHLALLKIVFSLHVSLQEGGDEGAEKHATDVVVTPVKDMLVHF